VLIEQKFFNQGGRIGVDTSRKGCEQSHVGTMH